MPDPMFPERISTAEAARLSGVHINTIRRWIGEGRLRAWRVGPRIIRVDPAELAELCVRVDAK